MTPHTQTILACPLRNDGHDANGTPGDCYRTAIAALLDLPILDVPHFALAGDDWWDATLDFARSRGAEFRYYPFGDTSPEPVLPAEWEAVVELVDQQMGGMLILGGPSPRGPFGHVVVGNTALETLHDPHPSRAGITRVDEAFVWFPAGLA